MDEESKNILKQIHNSLSNLESIQDVKSMTEEPSRIFEKVEKREIYAESQIQATFDKIHEKVFNFNSILIAIYLVFGTFPSEEPLINIWSVLIPIVNLILIILMDFRQMETYRLASSEMDWTDNDRKNYVKRIKNQTLFSLLPLGLSIICLLYLIIQLI